VVSFGWRYDFSMRELRKADEIPDFLLHLGVTATEFAGLDVSRFQHVLVTEYSPGAGIGWHKDRPEFEQVVGVSLLSPCLFRLRRKRGNGWERASIELQPLSSGADVALHVC
jgi:alkylated DNA repair dioxygenase AlkB